MKINHLGIATKGIDEALKFWSDALGLENVHTETVEDQKVRVAMLPLGESRIELLEPTSADSPISKFLEKRGGGIHHIAVEVENIESTLEKLRSQGMVVEYLNKNVRNAQLVLKDAVKRVAAKETPNQYRDAIKNAIFTAPDHWPAATAKKLDAIIGKYAKAGT